MICRESQVCTDNFIEQAGVPLEEQDGLMAYWCHMADCLCKFCQDSPFPHYLIDILNKKVTMSKASVSMKKTRDNRRAAGLCTDCGKAPPRPNRMTCFDCGKKAAEACAQYYSRNKLKYEPRLGRCVIGPRTLCGWRLPRDVPNGGRKPAKPRIVPLAAVSEVDARYTCWLIGFDPNRRMQLMRQLPVRFSSEAEACLYCKSLKLTGNWTNWKVSKDEPE